MQLLTTSFWQVCMQNACMLHAHLSRLSFSELDWYDECSWCTNHQSVFQSPLDRSACNFSSWSPECVPPVKIVCSACNLKVQLICDLPDPLPYAGFFMKRRKYFFSLSRQVLCQGFSAIIFLNRFKGKARHSPSLPLSFSSAHLAGAQLNLFQKFLTLFIFIDGILAVHPHKLFASNF